MAKDAKTIREELARPFAPEDLEWRIQVTSKDKTSGLAIPYVTNRAIQDRLDEVVGPENWYNDYRPWHGNGKKDAQICGISIYFEGKGFITKWGRRTGTTTTSRGTATGRRTRRSAAFPSILRVKALLQSGTARRIPTLSPLRAACPTR